MGYISVQAQPARARDHDVRDRSSQPASDSRTSEMPGRGPYKRLARQFREAGLRATPQEIVDLVDLERMVRRDELCVFDAQRILRRMIRRQHERSERVA